VYNAVYLNASASKGRQDKNGSRIRQLCRAVKKVPYFSQTFARNIEFAAQADFLD